MRESWRASGPAEGSPGTAGLRGDLDGDQIRSVADIDLLQDAIHAGTHARLFDLNGDGMVDREDLDELVSNILDTTYGDTDLNGIVNHTDFERLAANFGRSRVSWADGDFDGDDDVDFRDFNLLSIHFMISSGWPTILAA